MKSFIASLRNLVLPFGVTTGTRIVLDGVNGKISMYDAGNNAVIVEDSSNSSIVLTAPDLHADSMTLQPVGLNNLPTITFADNAGHNSYITSSAPGRISMLTDPANPYIYLNLSPGIGDFGSVSGGNQVGGRVEVGTTSLYLASYTAGVVDTSITLSSTGVAVSGPLALTNARNAMAGSNATETQTMVSGSSVVTTNASGDAVINTGLTTIRGYSIANGDAVSRPNITLGRSAGGIGSSSITVRVFTGNTGAVVAGANVRIDWTAFGVL